MKRKKVLGLMAIPLFFASCGSGCATPSDNVQVPLAIHSSEPVGEANAEAVQLKPHLPSATPQQVPLALHTLEPYFASAELKPALLAWHRANLATTDKAEQVQLRQDAAKVFSTYITSAKPSDPRLLPARYLLARIQNEQAHDKATWISAAEAFEALAHDWPLMADDIWVRAIRLYEQAGEVGKAAELLERFGQRFCLGEGCEGKESSAYGAEAADLEIFLLLGRGEVEQAKRKLETLARTQPQRLGPEGWAQLSELREDDKGRQEALFQLAKRFPNHELGKSAFSLLERDALSAEQKVVLGEALFDAGHYLSMRRLLAGFVKPSKEACKAWVLLGKAIERGNRRKKDKKESQKAFDYYDKSLACEGESRAEASFLAGRNRIAAGKVKEGLDLLQVHVSEFPNRSTADDAQLLIASEQKRDSESSANKTLLDTLRRYPEGDMADSVAWAVVEPHLVRRDWANVLKAVEDVLALAGDSIKGRHWGRYEYWKARSQLALGHEEAALHGFETTFLRYPLSYYAILSFSRIKQVDPERALALIEKAKENNEIIDLGWNQALWLNVHMQRAIEWARMSGGGPEVASPLTAQVLRELGEIPATLRSKQWAWLQTQVLQLGGAYARSMRLARTEEVERPLAFPTASSQEAWRLAYPRAFAEHVQQWAQIRELPEAWLWGVMRVESNFDPSAVSWANAIGLMQIIIPTAENLVRGTAHAPTRENLMRPEVAIELGSKYLARLLERHRALPLASAGYNAGGGAVGKWRRQFGDVEVDEFVERIPYREAHLYAKSVTQTWARYLWLYRGELPGLDLTPVGHPDAVKTEPAELEKPESEIAQ